MQGLTTGFATGDPSAIQARRSPYPLPFDAALVFQSASGVAAMAYTSVSGALVPRTTPWTIAFRVKPGAAFGSFATLVAKWSVVAGESAWAITRWGDGLAFFFDNGTSVASPRAYTDDAIFSGTAEREIAVSWDGTQAAWLDRVKIHWRAVGGTWAAATMLYTVQPPATLRDVATSVFFAVPGVLEAQAPSMELRDARIWGAVVIPSGTADMTTTGLTSRWRWRSLTPGRMSSPDEISGALMTLASTGGGAKLRPSRIADGWFPSATLNGKVLAIGNSKSADAVDRPSTWRYEAANQLAAGYGRSVDFVGRYTDTFALPAFSANAQHSALSGDLLSGGILTRCTADVITYTPDVVVIEGGTNDAFAAASATTIRDRMGSCIDAVLAASATARVVVCTDPPLKTTANAAERAVLATFNGLLPALVASKGGRVSLCDLYTVAHDADFVDNLHLNAVGCQRLGEELAVAIARVL